MSNQTLVHRVENETVLVLERVFNAPKELVFSMFKEAEDLALLHEMHGPANGGFLRNGILGQSRIQGN